MPVASYYGGHGRKVMRDMKKRYGKEHGKEVFYATLNKREQEKKRKKHHPGMEGLKAAR